MDTLLSLPDDTYPHPNSKLEDLNTVDTSSSSPLNLSPDLLLTTSNTPALRQHQQRRWNTISIPATYGRQNASIPPGTVVGIVLGSVGGTVLLFYLIFLALNPDGIPRSVGRVGSSIDDEEIVVRKSSSSRRGGGSQRRRRSDVIEVVEERERRRPSAASRRSRDRDRERVVVEESVTATSAATTDDDHVVEVVEEESSAVSSASPAPPRRSRGSRGYRTVDPYEYGGGNSHASRYR